ncbi:MAG: tRNA preQ1(34) S-adenosylmethionine ribosyltransferase-isomerase QueA [Acholeplasmatales bacterium]|jgi:S-adenosylmethionine:tRNA ribosyltransferase-isomerase|nr:tRNA preQ1(34) S-adenosylmethionine ribosyltransferase-isomerase QueA [Acholeplasmatales bacterium]
MKTTDFDYNLPEELIAQFPLEKRDTCKLLIYNKVTQGITHTKFYDIVNYFEKDDVLVLNDTKVIKARLFGNREKTNANIEFLVVRLIDLVTMIVMAKPLRRIKVGDYILFPGDLKVEVISIGDDNLVKVRCILETSIFEYLDKYGNMPLPPYIKKKLLDDDLYQTIYAKNSGSIAAPTAGFHFTKELLEDLKSIGVTVTYITLNVGLATFLPVKEELIENHKMHEELYTISEETCQILNSAIEKKTRIIGCGTTTLRALESNIKDNSFHKGDFATSIFIYPPYKIKSIDGLITNFHLPKSTLLMLLSSFIGTDEVRRIYNIAIQNEYRFFSFGDAMFVTNDRRK